MSAYSEIDKGKITDNTTLAKDADLHEAAGPEAIGNASHVIHDASGIHCGDSRDEKV